MIATVLARAAAPPAMLTSREVADVAGVSYRMLDYWTRNGAVRASIPAAGPGSQRRWTEHELVAVVAVARLAEMGARVDVLACLFDAVLELPLTTLPRVAAVDAAGVVRVGPGLDLEELHGSWLVLIDHPGRP